MTDLIVFFYFRWISADPDIHVNQGTSEPFTAPHVFANLSFDSLSFVKNHTIADFSEGSDTYLQMLL